MSLIKLKEKEFDIAAFESPGTCCDLHVHHLSGSGGIPSSQAAFRISQSKQPLLLGAKLSAAQTRHMYLEGSCFAPVFLSRVQIWILKRHVSRLKAADSK